MKKFSKKGVLLFASAMALCAFVLPSMASAASWSPVGLHTNLDSVNVGFTSSTHAGVNLESRCTSSSFTVRVASAQNLEILTGTFGGLCTAFALGQVCTTTARGTKFPWTATVPSTTNVQIHGVHIDVRFENTPGADATGCNALQLTGQDITITGTLTGGRFIRPDIIDLTDAEGLVRHSTNLALGNNTPITAQGSFTTTGGLTTTG